MLRKVMHSNGHRIKQNIVYKATNLSFSIAPSICFLPQIIVLSIFYPTQQLNRSYPPLGVPAVPHVPSTYHLPCRRHLGHRHNCRGTRLGTNTACSSGGGGGVTLASPVYSRQVCRYLFPQPTPTNKPSNPQPQPEPQTPASLLRTWTEMDTCIDASRFALHDSVRVRLTRLFAGRLCWVDGWTDGWMDGKEGKKGKEKKRKEKNSRHGRVRRSAEHAEESEGGEGRRGRKWISKVGV
ncbi:hypothetical protein IWX48DRAFT_14550 [Phyllosticta citricarpa]